MRTSLRLVLALVLASSGGIAAADAPFLNGLFPIGVWVPPDYSYATWQARGINTINEIAFDETTSIQTADGLGLHMMRAPQANPSDDANETLLLSWAHPDEPDGIYSQVPYTTIQAEYATWKSIAPNRPVFINFVGDLNQYDITTNESGDAWYEKYVAGADWISADKYPVNDGEASNLGVLGQMADHLHVLAGTKPIFAFIESTHINANDGGRGPTPDELRAEIWELIIHGVRGYFFFPEQIDPTFLFDTTPDDVVTEMTRQNAIVTSLAGVLQGPIDPPGLSVSVAAPLDAAWRAVPAGQYFFVLNLSNATRTAQKITLSGTGTAASAVVLNESRNVPIVSGVITDDFAAYAVHIYEVPIDAIFRDGFE
jgi:hypothetical protein